VEIYLQKIFLTLCPARSSLWVQLSICVLFEVNVSGSRISYRDPRNMLSLKWYCHYIFPGQRIGIYTRLLKGKALKKYVYEIYLSYFSVWLRAHVQLLMCFLPAALPRHTKRRRAGSIIALKPNITSMLCGLHARSERTAGPRLHSDLSLVPFSSSEDTVHLLFL